MKEKFPKRKCQGCDIIFVPKSDKNIFHNRKCFKRTFYHRKKAEELANKRNPVFNCPSCSLQITLDFDPVVENFKWLAFVCPGCSVLMINVSEEIVARDVTIV